MMECCLCVCVEHLNRCKTSHPYCHSRGHRPIVDTCANEAIPQWGKHRLINGVYLRFHFLFLRHLVFWEWQAAKPITASLTFCCLHVYRNLHFLQIICTGLSFSPFQNSRLHYEWVISLLVCILPFTLASWEFR